MRPQYDEPPRGGWAGGVGGGADRAPPVRSRGGGDGGAGAGARPAGDVNDRASPVMYRVEWTDETLASAPPIYEFRCQRDESDPGETWLPEAVLTADEGGPLSMEMPTLLRPRPLRMSEPRDRALAVF